MRYLSEDVLSEVIISLPLTIDDRAMIFARLKRRVEQDGITLYRCRECKWHGKAGCAIEIVDETDRPKENDFCSFAERETNDG